MISKRIGELFPVSFLWIPRVNKIFITLIDILRRASRAGVNGIDDYIEN